MWSFSCEKIELLARLAAERIARERAEGEFRLLRTLNAVMARFWSDNGERCFREHESAMLAALNDKPDSNPNQ